MAVRIIWATAPEGATRWISLGTVTVRPQSSVNWVVSPATSVFGTPQPEAKIRSSASSRARIRFFIGSVLLDYLLCE